MSAIDPLPLPEPPADLQEHSLHLKKKIIAEIRENDGSIGFDRYMEMALFDPEHGYYTAGLQKFGRDGDFITAPEVSRVFAYCLANQCRQIMDSTDISAIVEFGAGTGRLALDLLSRLQKLNSAPANYLIMETSADLRRRQQDLLQRRDPDHPSTISWPDTLPGGDINAIVIANEVIDCLPFQRVLAGDAGLLECRVGYADGEFEFVTGELSACSRQFSDNYLGDELANIRRGYVTEIHPRYPPWLNSVVESIQQGVILLFDYGYSGREYYLPERTNGTMLCHYRHRVHADPFRYPGLQDITSSVNFSVLSRVASESGIALLGYTTQAGFLLSCGLDKLQEELLESREMQRAQLNREIKTLTMPGEMGERFRLLALGKGFSRSLQACQFRDLSCQL
ncbi:MAG: SAM-dependent methyltransferase [Thiotrichales bacterium]|nr:SAM-dependent methyltransferase [Thiotrichales bacterium]